MGCGRLFEGDAATMWASLAKLMRLPDETRIWCGHEYTQGNGKFALTHGAGQCGAGGADEAMSRRRGRRMRPRCRQRWVWKRRPTRSCGRTQPKSARAWAWRRPTRSACSAKSASGRITSKKAGDYRSRAFLASSLSNGEVTTSPAAPTTVPAAPTAVEPTLTTVRWRRHRPGTPTAKTRRRRTERR